MRFSTGLKAILVGLLVVGIVFRFVNLNHKVYWHDEVYTSLRVAGYTRQEIDQRLFQNQIISAKDLLQFQRIKPKSTIADTVSSLAKEDPQHPPLYFVIARWWVQAFDGFLSTTFHSSLTTARSLPAILSLLGLPFMYALAWELFASHAIALMATTFLALSPFDVLFAQTARQYSLLTVMVIASQFLLLRALRFERQASLSSTQKSSWQHWGLYSLSVVIGLYTHPFFGLTIVAQVVYLVLEALRTHRAVLRAFGWALAAAIVLYAPWLYVMLTNAARAASVTDWTRISPGLDYLVKLWTLSFTALFLDLDFGFNNPVTYLLRVPIVLVIGMAIYTLYRRCDCSRWLSIVTSILVPFLLLALPDLVLGGKRSAVSRYLISCYPGIQLAVAYLLTTHLVKSSQQRPQRVFRSSTPYPPHPTPFLHCWLWRSVFTLLTAACLISLTVSAASFTWWNKDLSYFNGEVARRINADVPTIVISDIGDDFTNTGDLISLSYLLNEQVRLLLLQDTDWVKTSDFESQIQGATAIVFRPSQTLKQSLEQTHGSLEPLLLDAKLWQLPQ